MKANKILFATALSFITFQAMSPTELLSSRAPSSIDSADALPTPAPAPKSDICKAESKGEKLEADIKKLLEDKEAVLKEVDGLKKENEDLKSKIAVAPEVKLEAKNADAPLIALMGQMTSMFTAQMQMQVQMMTMLSQMQTNAMVQVSPYAFDPAGFSNIQKFGYPDAGQFGGFGVGLSAQSSPWSNYQNPYSMMPNLTRQQVSMPSDIGFTFNQPQPIQGFDFSQPALVPTQQRLPATQRIQLPPASQDFIAV